MHIHTCLNLTDTIWLLFWLGLAVQSSFRHLPFKPRVVLVLIAGERAELLFLAVAAASRRSTDVPPTASEPESGRTNTPLLPPVVQLHNVPGISSPLFSLCTACTVECCPLRLHHVRVTRHFIKYIWLNGVMITNCGRTNTTLLPPV